VSTSYVILGEKCKFVSNSTLQEETAMLSSPALGSKKKCGVDGCAKFAQTGGVCKKHGASKNVKSVEAV